MLHDGKRIRRIAPLLRENGAQVRQVLVGYLTGVGRDTMEQLPLSGHRGRMTASPRRLRVRLRA